jgi:tetratricopeptide (TPR) repeat protein
MQTVSSEEPLGQAEALLQAWEAAKERGDEAEAEAIGLQFIALAVEEGSHTQSESLRLTLQAREHEENAEWDQAEACFRTVLALPETQASNSQQFKTHSDLSSLYSLLGREERAMEEVRASLAAARREDMRPLLTMALSAMAGELLLKKDAEAALEAAEEALKLCGTKAVYTSSRAGALVLRARCALALGNLKTAETDLAAAWKLIEASQGAGFFAGNNGIFASWWAARSTLHVKRNEPQAAAEALAKAVEFRRMVSQAPQLAGPYKFNALAVTLYRYGTALLAVEDAGGAVAAYAESVALRAKIGLPPFERQ